jgi:hypothetical protein
MGAVALAPQWISWLPGVHREHDPGPLRAASVAASDSKSLKAIERLWARHALLFSILVSLLLFGGLALRVGATDGYRFQRAIGVGQLFAVPRLLLPGQPVSTGRGFDGQFYFYIAEDPFLRNPLTEPALDNSLRYRRILYPLLAWVFSLGQRAWVPYSLMAVNVASCTGAVAACALIARRAGRSPFTALVVAIFPGLWIPLLRDMTEPLQLCLAAWGMLLESAGLLFLSSLAKETTAIVQLGEVVRNLASRRLLPAARNLLLLGVLAGWALFVYRYVHAQESTLGGHLFEPPGAPFLELLRAVSVPARYVFLLPAVLLCVLSVLRLAWIRDRFAIGAALYGLVGLAAGTDTWIDPLAYYRVIALSGVLVFMSWVTARDRTGTAVVALMGVSGMVDLALALIPS